MTATTNTGTGAGAPTPIDGKGVWVFYSSEAGGPDGIVHWSKNAGLSHLIVKVGDGATFGDGVNDEVFRQQFLALQAPAAAAGLRLLTWSYCYLNDPVGEASVATWALDNGSAGHIFDVEAESEGKADNAQLLLDLVRARHPEAWLGYCPLPVISLHRALPYVQFNARCDAVLPQFYVEALGAPYDFAALFAEWEEWTARWQAAGLTVPPLAPVLDGYLPGNELTIAEYGPLAQQHGITSVSVWAAHAMSEEMWAALANLSLTPATAPAPLVANPVSYRCAHGHVWQSGDPLDAMLVTEAAVIEALGGPVCMRCALQALRQRFPAETIPA